MAENRATVACAPALSDAEGTDWRAVLEPLGASGDGTVGASLGWDLDWEREQLRSADGREHLSVRVYGDEVLVGPRWVPRDGLRLRGLRRAALPAGDRPPPDR